MSAPETSVLPSVVTVIATRDRPVLLRRAVRSVLDQSYQGPLDVVVVYDQSEPDALADVEVPAGRTLTVIANDRTPGLAGARNSGLQAATDELVAFCDDDDLWLPTKLARQISAWRADPTAIGLATGIRIVGTSSEVVRLPPARTEHRDFVESRLTEVHPSSFLFRREDLLAAGAVDERIPASYGEDYDLLLRMTERGHIRSVREPLTVVNWARASFFSDRWASIADGLTFILRKHEALRASRVGTARLAAQVAFAHAASGRRGQSFAWTRATLRRDRTQLRAYAALVVSAGVPPNVLLRAVNRFGRGL